jgi:hypothetical protein
MSEAKTNTMLTSNNSIPAIPNVLIISFEELIEKYQHFSKRHFLNNIKFGIVSNHDKSHVQCLMVSLDDFKQYFLDLPENKGFSTKQESDSKRTLTCEYNWATLLRQQYFKGDYPLSENKAFCLLDRLDEVYVYYINDGLPDKLNELNRRVAILFI